jgi:hypothetical protein
MQALERRWLPLSSAVAGWALRLAAADHTEAVVAFASSDPLFNTNTVALEGEIGFGRDIPMAQLVTSIGGGTEAGYLAQLVEPQYGEPNVLISVDPGGEQLEAPVDQALAQQAAQSAGFVLVRRFTLPDGRQGRLWWRSR